MVGCGLGVSIGLNRDCLVLVSYHVSHTNGMEFSCVEEFMNNKLYFIYISICVCIDVCVYVCMCACMYICMYV